MLKWCCLLGVLLLFSCRAIKSYNTVLPSGKQAQYKVYHGSGEFFIRSEIWDSTYFEKYEINCKPRAYFAISKDRIGLVPSFKNQHFIAVTDSVDGDYYQFGKKVSNSKNVVLVKGFISISADEKALFELLSKRSMLRCPEYPLDSVIGFVVNDLAL